MECLVWIVAIIAIILIAYWLSDVSQKKIDKKMATYVPANYEVYKAQVSRPMQDVPQPKIVLKPQPVEKGKRFDSTVSNKPPKASESVKNDSDVVDFDFDVLTSKNPALFDRYEPEETVQRAAKPVESCGADYSPPYKSSSSSSWSSPSYSYSDSSSSSSSSSSSCSSSGDSGGSSSCGGGGD